MNLPFRRGKKRRRAKVDGPLRWRQFIGLFLLFTAFAVGVGVLAAQLHRDSNEAEAADSASAAPFEPNAGTSAGSAQSTVATSEPTSEPTPEPTPEGSVVVAGLRLRVAGVDREFDASDFDPTSRAAMRIELELTNEADADISVSAFEFSLLDNGGTGYEIAPCTGCPGSLEDPLDVEPGETERGALYYDLPDGSAPMDLRYRSRVAGEDVTLVIAES